MENRTLKIEEIGDYFFGTTRQLIRLKGIWPAALGFKPNSKVKVRADAGQLILIPKSGFTLVEMLVVIMITGLIAALWVLVIENMSRGTLHDTVTPTQLKQDLMFARTTAEATGRPTYVLFNTTSWAQNTNVLDGLYVTTNVLPFLSYTVVEYGNAGDPLNQHHWTMIRTWEQLDYPYSFNIKPYLVSDQCSNVETVQPLTIGNVTFPAIGFGRNGSLDGLYTNSTFVSVSTNCDCDTVRVDLRTGFPVVEQPHVR